MNERAPYPLRPPAGQNFNGGHPRWGAPRETFCYADNDGPLFYVCHYESPEQDEPDEVRVATWTWGTAIMRWQTLSPPNPRPLYRLDQLQAKTEAPILIVSDEVCADAAQRIMRETIVTTWHGGLSHARVADWSAIARRTVNIWPKAVEGHWESASKIAGWLLQLECTVGIVDTHGQPAGWDLSDAIQQGWKLSDVLSYARDRKRPITRPAPPLKVQTPITDSSGHGMGESSSAASKRITNGSGAHHEPQEQDPEPEPDKVDLAPGPPPDDSTISYPTLWRQYELALDGNGRPHMNVDNVIRVISKHPGTWSNVWYDEFLQKIISRVDGEQREWTDVDTLKLMLWFQRALGFAKLGSEVVHSAIHLYAHGRRRNEARDWLKGLKWDEVERLPSLLPRGFGTRDDDYHRAVGRCFIMGICQRILVPGCKLDNLPVFEGAEGIFKSTALSIIGGPYYATTHERVGDKDFYLVFPGKMLIEISELNSFSRAEVERVKGVVSDPVDRYRAPYGRAAMDHPRMCVFAATTNVDDWNTSDTGARRMWPVTCIKIDTDWLRSEREQFFAEAMIRLSRDELWYDVPVQQARKEQALRHVGDLFDEALGYFLATRDETTIPSCLDALGISDKDKWTPKNQTRVSNVLRRAGFIPTRAQQGSGQLRIWRRRLPAQPAMPPGPAPLDF